MFCSDSVFDILNESVAEGQAVSEFEDTTELELNSNKTDVAKTLHRNNELLSQQVEPSTYVSSTRFAFLVKDFQLDYMLLILRISACHIWHCLYLHIEETLSVLTPIWYKYLYICVIHQRVASFLSVASGTPN